MIRINECGEPLVRIEKNMPFAIEERWNPNGVWLRKTVLDLLVEAKKNLPRGISFIIHSGWRSVDEQKQTFEETKSYLSRINPKVSKEKLLEMTKQYVHPYQGKKASGHLTGGAVDLRLYKNGRRLPMRSSKLSYKENATTFQPKLPNYIQRNRQLLYEVMTGVGFVNYPLEYWHYSYGDYYWAKANGVDSAIYGIMERSLSDE